VLAQQLWLRTLRMPDLTKSCASLPPIECKLPVVTGTRPRTAVILTPYGRSKCQLPHTHTSTTIDRDRESDGVCASLNRIPAVLAGRPLEETIPYNRLCLCEVLHIPWRKLSAGVCRAANSWKTTAPPGHRRRAPSRAAAAFWGTAAVTHHRAFTQSRISPNLLNCGSAPSPWPIIPQLAPVLDRSPLPAPPKRSCGLMTALQLDRCILLRQRESVDWFPCISRKDCLPNQIAFAHEFCHASEFA
jgi:hypothetical protein